MFANVAGINRIKRKQIAALISTDPSVIILIRKTHKDDGVGGVTATEDLIDYQIGKLIGREATGQFPERINEQGQTVSISHILVMDRKADIQIGDRFILDGQIHEIVYIHADRKVATRAEVITTNGPRKKA